MGALFFRPRGFELSRPGCPAKARRPGRNAGAVRQKHRLAGRVLIAEIPLHQELEQSGGHLAAGDPAFRKTLGQKIFHQRQPAFRRSGFNSLTHFLQQPGGTDIVHVPQGRQAALFDAGLGAADDVAQLILFAHGDKSKGAAHAARPAGRPTRCTYFSTSCGIS